MQSKAGHGGHAKADVWFTEFGAARFVVSGTLRDRDRHPGHCAYLRVRFHYVGGGTEWTRPRTTCSRTGFRFSSAGQVHRADVRVCVLDRTRRATLKCHADAIKKSIVDDRPR